MKKLFILFTCVFVAAVVVSCHDSDVKVVVRNMSKSDCKVTLSSAPLQLRANGMPAEPEAIVLTALDNGFLKFQHANVLLGCDCEEVLYGVMVKDNQILLSEDAGESLVNCLCTMDSSCEIGPLEDGDYILTLLDRDGQKLASVSFTYSKNLNLEVPLSQEK